MSVVNQKMPLRPRLTEPQQTNSKLVRHPAEATMVRAERPDILAFTVTTAVGIVALMWSYSNDLLLVYSDSVSHLNIARRVLDNRTPGITQFGTVWLPVPHLLMQPFIYVDPLWHTGLAGSIVGLFCFVVTGVTLYLSIRLIARQQAAAWIGLAVFLSNPNVLYIQTTALTEPVLLAAMTASTYFLLRWNVNKSYRNLVVAGFFATLAVGSRYDGWFFAAVSAAVVLVAVYLQSHNPAQAEGTTLAYAALPVYAMFMWFYYNWQIWGDPLEFQRGQFSAQFQQQQIALSGGLPTVNNWGLSILTYSWAVVDNLGVLGAMLAGVGTLAFLVAKGFHPGTISTYLFLAVFPFNVIALWLGQTTIGVPQSSPPGMFNVRYGLLLLPAAAVFIAWLADLLMSRFKSAIVLSAMGLFLVIQFILYLPNWPGSIILVADGLGGSSSTPAPLQTAQYLREHYDGGGILIDDTNSQAIHEARIPMREYIATFSGLLWHKALLAPSSSVRWVVMHTRDTSDRVTAALIDNIDFKNRFKLAFEDKGYAVYRRIGD